MGSFTYIVEGGVIHIHCRGWGHSDILQRVGSFTYIVEGGGTEGGAHTYITDGGIFTYIVEGGVIHIHCRGWRYPHTLQRVGSFTYIVEGGVIHIHCRGWGHSHTL